MTKIALVTQHTENFKELADLTFPGKEKYAEKHGYSIFCQTGDWFVFPKHHLGYEKCWYIEKLMQDNPDIEWFWWSGADCLITNHTKKLEDLIDNNYHFIVCLEHGGPQADVFFIRNTPEGREYISHLKQEHPGGSEQAAMWVDRKEPKWQAITKYLPLSSMNSFDLQWYPHLPKNDGTGNRASWEDGDFVLQAVTGGRIPKKDLSIYEFKVEVLKMYIDRIKY